MRNAILIASLLFTACATNGTGEDFSGNPELDTHADGKADGQGCDFTTLQGFYDAFGYRAIPHADGSNSYRVAFTYDSTVPLANGDRAGIEMYLLENQRVIVEYHEEHADTEGSVVVNEALVVTTASIDATGQIRLAGVAHGTPTQYASDGRCSPGINFTFDADIKTAGLKDHSGATYMGTSSRWVVDPDHLDQIPSESGREYFKGQIADGTITVLHRQ